MSDQFRIVAVLKTLLALLLCGAGIWLVSQDLAFARSGKKADATVTGWRRSSRSGGWVDVSYAADGTTRHASFHAMFSEAKGTQVEIVYLPDQDGRVQRSGSFEGSVIGVLAVLGALAYLFRGVFHLSG